MQLLLCCDACYGVEAYLAVQNYKTYLNQQNYLQIFQISENCKLQIVNMSRHRNCDVISRYRCYPFATIPEACHYMSLTGCPINSWGGGYLPPPEPPPLPEERSSLFTDLLVRLTDADSDPRRSLTPALTLQL